jgi:hypothetical protein
MRKAVSFAIFFASLVAGTVYGQSASTMADDQVNASYLQRVKPYSLATGSNADGGGVLGKHSSGAVLGVDSVANWSSYFYQPGCDLFGGTQFTWGYTMVGHAPFGIGEDQDWQGETTRIGAPIVPVSLDLRNADGTPRFVNRQRLFSDATQFVPFVLASPVFSNTTYDSSERPTQFTDAIQRAEFFHMSDDDWHTMLKPRVATPRTMVLLKGRYQFALNADGSCCLFVLIDENTFGNALFPAVPTDTTTPIGAAENAGDIRTKDISTFLFPNAYLFSGKLCCVLGFHTYDIEPGSASNGWQERRYVLNYSSWITPGLFNGGFQDITALSHEMSETFNDPFVNNATPWWLAPSGQCQNNLETGDVIEGLANPTFPITLNGATWHPQTEALLPWFAGVTPSKAIHGACSYPDITALTMAKPSQNPGCTPAL